jgi:hypothetical protein
MQKGSTIGLIIRLFCFCVSEKMFRNKLHVVLNSFIYFLNNTTECLKKILFFLTFCPLHSLHNSTKFAGNNIIN